MKGCENEVSPDLIISTKLSTTDDFTVPEWASSAGINHGYRRKATPPRKAFDEATIQNLLSLWTHEKPPARGPM